MGPDRLAESALWKLMVKGGVHTRSSKLSPLLQPPKAWIKGSGDSFGGRASGEGSKESPLLSYPVPEYRVHSPSTSHLFPPLVWRARWVTGATYLVAFFPPCWAEGGLAALPRVDAPSTKAQLTTRMHRAKHTQQGKRSRLLSYSTQREHPHPSSRRKQLPSVGGGRDRVLWGYGLHQNDWL